jgi:LCP family protein required for cell wall assembly
MQKEENMDKNSAIEESTGVKKENRKIKIKHSSDVRRKIALSRIKRRLLKHVWLVRVGIVVGVFTAFILFGVVAFALIKNTTVGLYIGLASDFVFTPKEKIEAIDGRTNILILGKGGQNHNAPDLTDTIMFVSFDHQSSAITIISLPRDIWIPALRAKLNSMYYWGNEKEIDGGLKLAKSSVEEIVGQPIHYGLVINFEGFQEIIDVMDGVSVEVENSFTDEWFPIEGKEDDECDGDLEYKCRYETIVFKSGRQLMDGETALKYVRSRNAEGDEGTDVARAARQQRLLGAIKEKALSKEILLSPKTLLKLKSVTARYIETDIDSNAAAILARRTYQAKDVINSPVLLEEYLVNPPKSLRYDNLYVFISKDGSWNKVHEWVECVLRNEDCEKSTQDETGL